MTNKSQYFFNSPDDSQDEKESVPVDVLTKALKLFRASELGDNKEFARQKYNAFLMDNSLSHFQVLEFERKDIKTQPEESKKKVVVLGVEFNSMADFKKWFEEANFIDKWKVVFELIRNGGKPHTK